MLGTALLFLLWVLAGAHPLERREDGVTEGDDDVQPTTADVVPLDESTSTGQPADFILVSVAASSLASPPPTQQQSLSLTLTDLNAAGTVTATSTVHIGTTSTTTSTSVMTSTVTVLVTSTNLVTTVITTKEDTATSTGHVTVTTTVQPAPRRHPAWAKGREQHIVFTTLSPVRTPPQRVPTTTTQTLTEVDTSIATMARLIPFVETVTLVHTTNVPVTSLVYDDAKTTVTFNTTHTVTTTTFPPSTSTATVISTTPSSPEPTTDPPPLPNPGLPLKTKAAIGGSVATLIPLLVIAVTIYRHYQKKQLAKQDTSPSALADNNHGSGPFNPGNATGHHANLDGREPTIPNLSPDPAVLGTARTGILIKTHELGGKPPMTETPGRSRLPMVGPRQSPRQSMQSHRQTRVEDEEKPGPSDYKGKGKASLWQGGRVPSFSRFKEHMEEETDAVFGSCPRSARPAHLRGLAVTDNTGRFAPGSGEHGRYSAQEWKLDPVRQELEGDKKKQAWELPASTADENVGRTELEKETAESVYGDAEEHVEGRGSNL